MHTWAEGGTPTKLVARQPASNETDKALACYGAVRQDTAQRYLYFAQGQPNTEHTCLMLEKLLAIAQAENKAALLVIWDRASWHQSHQLKHWVRQHNRQAKQQGTVRLLTFLLPVKSPWLNPMEPIWLHAKRNVDEADGQLAVTELKSRLCAHFHTDLDTASLKPSDG